MFFDDVRSEIVSFRRLAWAVLRPFRERFQDDARNAFFEAMLSHVSFFEDVPNEIVIFAISRALLEPSWGPFWAIVFHLQTLQERCQDDVDNISIF